MNTVISISYLGKIWLFGVLCGTCFGICLTLFIQKKNKERILRKEAKRKARNDQI